MIKINSSEYIIRKLSLKDKNSLNIFFLSLSNEEKRFRFGYIPSSFHDEQLSEWSNPDNYRYFSFGLFKKINNEFVLSGVTQAFVDINGEAEWAIVINKEDSGFGLAKKMTKKLIKQLEMSEAKTMVAHTSAENLRLKSLSLHFNFSILNRVGNEITLIKNLNKIKNRVIKNKKTIKL